MVCKLSQTGLADKTNTTSKNNAVSNITGEESAASSENDTNKSKEPNNKGTTATASLIQGSILDVAPFEELSSADTSSDSESNQDNSVKNTDAKPVRDQMIQCCKSAHMQAKQKSVAFAGVPDSLGSNVRQE
eukprot:7545011-Ditylum_brightwellii.AAC.2